MQFAQTEFDTPAEKGSKGNSMSERKQGTVKWFDNAKGYGFIISPEGDDVFVHYRAIVGDGYRSLSEGQTVEFVASRGDKGWQASEVEAVN